MCKKRGTLPCVGKPSRGKKLIEEDFSRIAELRKERLTGDEIALRLGLCRSSVFRALRTHR